MCANRAKHECGEASPSSATTPIDAPRTPRVSVKCACHVSAVPRPPYARCQGGGRPGQRGGLPVEMFRVNSVSFG